MLWIPSIGASGLMVYTGEQFPEWKGQLFAGGLSGLQLHRFAFNEKGGLLGREAMLEPLRQRIRDVRQGPDGYIYLAVDLNPGGVLRLGAGENRHQVGGQTRVRHTSDPCLTLPHFHPSASFT